MIFNSCSHGGAADIIREVAGMFPGKTVYAIIGGFHLYNKSKPEVLALAKEIQQTGIAYVYRALHREQAYQPLHRELGEKSHPAAGGPGHGVLREEHGGNQNAENRTSDKDLWGEKGGG